MRTFVGRFFNEVANFLYGGVGIQEHGGGLNGRHFALGQIEHNLHRDDRVANGADTFNVGFNNVARPEPFLRITAGAYA